MNNTLQHILRNQEAAKFYINTPRLGYLKTRTFKDFIKAFAKTEATKMEAERVSPNGETVKIWLRGYSANTYMIETERDNVLIEVPEA